MFCFPHWPLTKDVQSANASQLFHLSVQHRICGLATIQGDSLRDSLMIPAISSTCHHMHDRYQAPFISTDSPPTFCSSSWIASSPAGP